MGDADEAGILGKRERIRQREHCEQSGVTIYEVVVPTVGQIRIHQMWGSRVGDEVCGGASFAQDSATLPITITTSLENAGDDDADGPVSQAASLRPFGLVSDRLREIRYPEDFATFERADWMRWLEIMREESESWITDRARWVPASVVVDDAVYQGVRTRVDDSFVAGAFYLPEGRLDVSIEVLAPVVHHLAFDELRIVRSSDLERVSWDD